VGWAWQEFFSSVIGAMIAEEDRYRAGLVAMLKAIFAVLVLVGGARVELRWFQHQPDLSTRSDNVTTPLL
jgi:hypothetical protein